MCVCCVRVVGALGLLFSKGYREAKNAERRLRESEVKREEEREREREREEKIVNRQKTALAQVGYPPIFNAASGRSEPASSLHRPRHENEKFPKIKSKND